MSAILKEILILPEVIGSCVVDKDLGTQLSELPEFFTDAMAIEVNKHVRRMLQMAEMVGMDPRIVFINYRKFKIIAISLNTTFLLLILCKPGCNISLVTTTAFMLAPELIKILNQSIITIEFSPTDSPSESDKSSVSQVSPETADALEYIKKSLFEIVGPVAGMIFDDCIKQWTKTDLADTSRIPELIGYISMAIDNPDLDQEFKTKISSIL